MGTGAKVRCGSASIAGAAGGARVRRTARPEIVVALVPSSRPVRQIEQVTAVTSKDGAITSTYFAGTSTNSPHSATQRAGLSSRNISLCGGGSGQPHSAMSAKKPMTASNLRDRSGTVISSPVPGLVASVSEVS
jgi:hypothetical protein